MAAKQMIGALSNRVEHRLHVRRQTGNDTKDFGRRRLLLSGFLQLVDALVALLLQIGYRQTLAASDDEGIPAPGLGGLAGFRLAHLEAPLYMPRHIRPQLASEAL